MKNLFKKILLATLLTTCGIHQTNAMQQNSQIRLDGVETQQIKTLRIIIEETQNDIFIQMFIEDQLKYGYRTNKENLVAIEEIKNSIVWFIQNTEGSLIPDDLAQSLTNTIMEITKRAERSKFFNLAIIPTALLPFGYVAGAFLVAPYVAIPAAVATLTTAGVTGVIAHIWGRRKTNSRIEFKIEILENLNHNPQLFPEQVWNTEIRNTINLEQEAWENQERLERIEILRRKISLIQEQLKMLIQN